MTDKILRERSEILDSDGNIIVSAGAGAGKTSIMIDKIIKQSKVKGHYKIAAITFTKKATNEIKQRLNSNIKENFVGTIDGFIEKEIIRIFINDAIGPGYNTDFVVNYDKTQNFYTYDEGIKKLKDTNQLCCYHNSVKKNFKFELALNILKKSKIAKQYLIAKYSHIYIDEYQDCDNEMHELFKFLKGYGIKLFIIGDTKQSIYEWRGANSKLFDDIFKGDNDFIKCELLENFRCAKGISNFANIIQYQSLEYIDESEENNSVYMIQNLTEDYFDMKKEITILVRKNSDGELLAKKFKEFIFIPKSPIDLLDSINKDVFIQICKFIKDKYYSEFNFVDFMSLGNEIDISKLKKYLNRIKDSKSKEDMEKCVRDLFKMLDIAFQGIDEVDKLWKTVTDKKYEKCYDGKQYKHKILTIHASKGLEFDEVVLFAKDYKNIFNGEDFKEHYVATTRAKTKLTIVLDSEQYLRGIQKICKGVNKEIQDFASLEK